MSLDVVHHGAVLCDVTLELEGRQNSIYNIARVCVYFMYLVVLSVLFTMRVQKSVFIRCCLLKSVLILVFVFGSFLLRASHIE